MIQLNLLMNDTELDILMVPLESLLKIICKGQNLFMIKILINFGQEV